ncbi:MAG: hypothetical protein ACFB03_05205 [Paracoccaceae bacterium]
MLPTSKQFGREMREQKINWPAPLIGKADRQQDGVEVFRVGQRSAANVFVLVRRGWGTVYAAPSYTDYRNAFKLVIPLNAEGREVDHLFPKSKASDGEFCALGLLSRSANASYKDDEDFKNLQLKISNFKKSRLRDDFPLYTSQLTDMQRGWAGIRGFIFPLHQMNNGVLTRVT